jgi:hypothetical protein
VAEGTRLLSEYGGKPPSRVRIPPSPLWERRVRVEGATFTRLGVHGLVVEDVHFWDVAGLMAQLTDGAPSSPDSD